MTNLFFRAVHTIDYACLYAYFLCSRISRACSLPDQRAKIVSTWLNFSGACAAYTSRTACTARYMANGHTQTQSKHRPRPGDSLHM